MNELFKWIIKMRLSQIGDVRNRPLEVQSKWFFYLLSEAKQTDFGKKYGFSTIKTVQQFREMVPLHFYDTLKTYIDKQMRGEEDVIWKGKTDWFAKSSGTTAGISKFIPVTEESLFENHYKAGKDLLANYYEINPEADLFSGKTLVIGGSSKVNELSSNSYTGDLSAIIIKNLPWWVEMKRTPTRETALLSDWEEKLEKMAIETMDEDVRILSGVPSWTLFLCHRILEIKNASTLQDIWSNLELFMHGGVNFEPYRAEFKRIIPKTSMNYLETYNASEGMFGFQDRLNKNGMLLLLDHGIYYEFIPMRDFNGVDSENVIGLEEVETGVNYALVISTLGGLWRYIVGDTIQFISTFPFRFKVTGRTKSFINAFGEELIVENAEKAIAETSNQLGIVVTNYTAAPVYMEFQNERPQGQHEWIVEMIGKASVEEFRHHLDENLRKVNSDYDAKRVKDIAFLAPKIHIAPIGTFEKWLKSRGKLGGQHKVPRLCNDRVILEDVLDQMKK